MKKLLSYLKVFWFFKSIGKTKRWFAATNPLLGGVSANWMIEIGRSAKLYKIICNQLEENKK